MDGNRWLGRTDSILFGIGILLAGAFIAVHLVSSGAKWWFERTLIEESHSAGMGSAPGPPAAAKPESVVYEPGSVVGLLEIPRLGLSTLVLEGVEARTLELGSGHIPGTAFPGAPGSVAIAGHRDREFQRLKDLRHGDEILIRNRSGLFRYSVDSLLVVHPQETSVLAPGASPRLILVTCYPFYYVGRAPQRFVAMAEEIRSAERAAGRTPAPSQRPREPRERREPRALADRNGGAGDPRPGLIRPLRP